MKSLLKNLFLSSLVAVLLAGTSLAADTTAKFKVTGMYCDACQTKIQHALSKTDGVKSATVDLNSGSATVTYDDGKVKPIKLSKLPRRKATRQNWRRSPSSLGPPPSRVSERCRMKKVVVYSQPG